MEAHIGRKLARAEHVHHVNGKSSDNRLENLLVCSPREHRLIHGHRNDTTGLVRELAEAQGWNVEDPPAVLPHDDRVSFVVRLPNGTKAKIQQARRQERPDDAAGNQAGHPPLPRKSGLMMGALSREGTYGLAGLPSCPWNSSRVVPFLLSALTEAGSLGQGANGPAGGSEHPPTATACLCERVDGRGCD